MEDIRILRIQPERDTFARYNYHINYGALDSIRTHMVSLEHFDADLNEYDVVFLPMHGRWKNHMSLLQRIKSHKIKSVIFDNDSCFNDFYGSFYQGIDYIFYRYFDKNDRVPERGSFLMWSIDPDLYRAKYVNTGVSFNCSWRHHSYRLRREIARHIKPTNFKGAEYIEHLQNHAVAIHTNSEVLPYVRAKVLEFASCGCQIISNRATKRLNMYFPDELIIYFDTVRELLDIVKDFKGDIDTQRRLREIVEDRHTHKKNAEFILNQIQKIL